MTKEEAIELVKQDAFGLENLDAKFKNDREIVMTAVSINGNAFKYASEELKNDREIAMAAVSNHGSVLQYVSEVFKNDREIVMAAVSNSGYALEYASEKLKNDREIVMAAMILDDNVIKYASKQLREEILMTTFEVVTTTDLGINVFESKKHKLQVALDDLESPLKWDEISDALREWKMGKGDGWRLPTIVELELIYRGLHLKSIGNFSPENYWSSTTRLNSTHASTLVFTGGYDEIISLYRGNNTIPVRAVRSI
jgi:hypothetical protein